MRSIYPLFFIFNRMILSEFSQRSACLVRSLRTHRAKQPFVPSPSPEDFDEDFSYMAELRIHERPVPRLPLALKPAGRFGLSRLVAGEATRPSLKPLRHPDQKREEVAGRVWPRGGASLDAKT